MNEELFLNCKRLLLFKHPHDEEKEKVLMVALEKNL